VTSDSSRPATDDEVLEQLVDSFQQRLAADGWRVGIDRSSGDPPSRTVTLDHALATRHDIHVLHDSTPDEIRRLLDYVIEYHRDISLMRVLPRPTLHHELMNQLRISTATYRWQPSILKQVVHTLIAADLLTESEAEWVVRAGPTVMRGPDERWSPR
jgi:hypothetical protein